MEIEGIQIVLSEVEINNNRAVHVGKQWVVLTEQSAYIVRWCNGSSRINYYPCANLLMWVLVSARQNFASYKCPFKVDQLVALHRKPSLAKMCVIMQPHNILNAPKTFFWRNPKILSQQLGDLWKHLCMTRCKFCTERRFNTDQFLERDVQMRLMRPESYLMPNLLLVSYSSIGVISYQTEL